jgi:hypothetical protein
MEGGIGIGRMLQKSKKVRVDNTKFATLKPQTKNKMPQFQIEKNFSSRKSSSKMKSFRNSIAYSNRRRNPSVAKKVSVKPVDQS